MVVLADRPADSPTDRKDPADDIADADAVVVGVKAKMLSPIVLVSLGLVADASHIPPASRTLA